MVFSCLCYLKMEETCSIETVDFPWTVVLLYVS
jgi:hypothetical protein